MTQVNSCVSGKIIGPQLGLQRSVASAEMDLKGNRALSNHLMICNFLIRYKKLRNVCKCKSNTYSVNRMGHIHPKMTCALFVCCYYIAQGD